MFRCSTQLKSLVKVTYLCLRIHGHPLRLKQSKSYQNIEIPRFSSCVIGYIKCKQRSIFSPYLNFTVQFDASSVDWVARVRRNFRFREGVPLLVKKGGFGAVLGGFRHQRAPQVVGRRQHLMGNPLNLARCEGNHWLQLAPHIWAAPTGTTHLGCSNWHHTFGHHIFGTTIEGTFVFNNGKILAPHFWHHGTTYLAPRHHTFGHLTSLAPHVTCISQSEARDGARWSPSAVPHVPNLPHIWYLGTSHLAPHIWHLTFGTSYLAPHIGHLTSAPHLSTSHLGTTYPSQSYQS